VSSAPRTTPNSGSLRPLEATSSVIPVDAFADLDEPSTSPAYEDIPEKLKAKRNWVNYLLVPKVDKLGNPVLKANGTPKMDKIPYNPAYPFAQKRKAKSNNSKTWGSFEQAVANEEGFAGIGFMFGTEEVKSGFGGFDADDCIVSGQIAGWAKSVLNDVKSYTEYSQSGEGIHSIFLGELPGSGTHIGSAELYDCGRFFAFTGKRLPEYPDDVHIYDCCALYNRIKSHEFEFSASAEKPKDSATPRSSRAVYTPNNLNAKQKIELSMRGEIVSDGHPFEARYGDRTITTESQSEADMSLASLLMRKHRGDVGKADADFRASILMRDKWDRQDYRDDTLNKAFKSYAERQEKQKPEFTGYLAEPPVPPAGIPQPSSEFVPTSCTADTIQPKQIRWLWLHRFAEKINLLVGNPDNGKGLVSLHTVARLTTGEPWFDAENKLPPSEALILAAEDDWDDIIVPRLIAAGADLKKVHKLVMSAQINGSKVEKELSLDRDRSVLDNYLQKHPSIRLVVIDPVSNYLGRTKMIDEQSVRELLAPFKEMASRLHVAFLCIMHLNKKVELDAIHRIGGAMAFTGIARMVWLCAPKPNEDGTDSDEMLMVKVKGNIVQRTLKGLSFKVGVHPVPIEDVSTEIPYVEWKGAVNQSANDLMSSHKRAAHRPNDRRQEAINWLNEYLSDGAKPLDEVEYTGLKMHGFDPKLLQRARKDAGIVTFADGSKRKGRDGKNRDAYSCRLPETLSGEVTNQQGAF